jgi:TRAP-type C4-dicarboxylate transport system permease large subunit
MEIFILVLTFLILLAIGVPVAWSIGLSSICTMLVSIPTIPALTTIGQRMLTGLDSFALLAIPFFILAGQMMSKGGIARRLIDFAKTLVGALPGGLAYVNIIAAMLFGAISGSAVAAASALGSMLGKRMEEEGYAKEFAAAVNVTSSTTGLIIPPSNILIVYSLASGGVSIGALFVAGYLPGLMVGLFLMLVAGYISIRKKYVVYQKIDTQKASRRFLHALPGLVVIWGLISFTQDIYGSTLAGYWKILIPLIIWGLYIGIMYLFSRGIHENRLSQTQKIATLLAFFFVGGVWAKREQRKSGIYYRFTKGTETFIDALPSLLLLVIVIGGIVMGIFTATEASAVAVLYVLVLSFVYGEINVKELPEVFKNSVSTTAIVMLLIGTSMSMSWIMAYENIPQGITEILLSVSDSKIAILMIINMILLVVGVFMDMTPAVLIFTPIFLPVVTELGMDPIHFGIIMVLNLCVGLCTPPVGSVLFVGVGVAGTTIQKVIRPLLPLFIAMLIALIIVTYVPALSLWLPRLLGL